METYTYDRPSNLLSKTDRKSQTIQYVYDALNRLTQKTYPGSATVAYTYDAGSRLTHVWLLLAEGHPSRRLFGSMLSVIAAWCCRTVSEPGQKQTSARKPSSGEVSAARQTGAGKTSTAAPQNGQNEPHYHPKRASATCV